MKKLNDDEFLEQEFDFRKAVKNPYRDLYPSDGVVMNEWLH